MEDGKKGKGNVILLREFELVVVSVEPSEKSVEIMRKFSEQYARKSGTYFCVDKGVTSVVIKVCVATGSNLPCYYED